jgi:hypothetical protein
VCILTANDEIQTPTARDKVVEAFNRLDRAHAALLRMALRLDEGDTAADFAGIHADAQIRKVVGDMHSARYMADEALCGLMRGETYRLRPTSQGQAVEMVGRMLRNGRSAAPASALPAVCSFAAE